jgi:hypothetical protein
MKFLYFAEQSNERPRRWSFIPMCLVLIPFLCLLLTSCNGSDGVTAGGGIDGTGIMSAGVVNAFGSIEVNGTEFDTTNAVVIVNVEEKGVGDEVVEENLRVGMVVSVEGRVLDNGNVVADRIIYSSNVVGPVENISGIDDTTKEIVVLGQTVIVNIITEFEPDTYTFDSIAPDDVVEVSGYLDNNRVIRATFIGNITDDVEFEVTGFIENLNSNSKTFQINDLIVNYSRIDSSNLPQDFNDGLFVEVEGDGLDDISGELFATAIRLGDEADMDDVDDFEIMGFVTEIISKNGIIKFKVGNQEVHVNADPDIVEYVDGNPEDIAPGQKLEAKGSLVDGILIADEIEFWEPDQVEAEGIVDEVDFIDGFPEFTFEERDDQIFLTDTDTEFEDIRKDEIEIGLPLEVKGVPQNLEQSVIKADKVSLELK